jgi:hypothetical protein
MSDTFTFVAPAMPRRRPEPFTMRLLSVTAVLALVVAGFATFVVRAERAADARQAVLEEQAVARERAEADRLAVEAEAGLARQQTATTTVPAGVARLLDAQARDAAGRALALAEGTLGDNGDLSSAGVTELAQLDGGLLFVDGPSTAPTIVSVAASTGSWGAAVLGPSGTCYWVSLDAQGSARYGHGSTCTGQAALAAARVSW